MNPYRKASESHRNGSSSHSSGILPAQTSVGARWEGDTSGPRALMLAVLALVAGRRISPPAPGVVPAENDAISDGGTTMSLDMTLLDLVDAVADHAKSDAKVIATVVYMVNSGAVLRGET
jgi:hypothetical protein